ncbi:DUF72 domain-containing protein [Mucilaginibacter hurinus]|uniref:DUF72 domain-containing protein n=1 Tax=Mucilaginibacter hurinus TaxID=2201324 RepID=A0A367GUC2_9SPHI|nr:DUF72 domain-containing protein [Mucilaginibacter hurinus]RCH56900.1 DUF72 domain-containing protein [Mucilaginibacter hurinus]
MAAKFYSGTSNIELPVRNKQFYPEAFRNKSRLNYYASMFNSVEQNCTFYKVPMPTTIKKWADDVPGDFRFTFKLWREITHQKELEFKPKDVERFMQVIDNAREKKGSLLIQFPPSIQVNKLHKMEYLLSIIRSCDPDKQWDTAVEFRHKSWYMGDVYEMLDKFNMAMVYHDMPASATPTTDPRTKFVFLRFHGPNGGYRGSYTDDYLYEYATYIRDWLEEGKTVYAYFNNTMGDAVKNVNTLNSFLASA